MKELFFILCAILGIWGIVYYMELGIAKNPLPVAEISTSEPVGMPDIPEENKIPLQKEQNEVPVEPFIDQAPVTEPPVSLPPKTSLLSDMENPNDTKDINTSNNIVVPGKIPESYRIQKGDTLSDIAMRKLGSFKLLPLLMERNNDFDPRSLAIGSELYLPSRTDVIDYIANKNLNPQVETPGTYKINSGDTYYSISKKLYGDFSMAQALMDKNPDVPANMLKKGSLLRLPE